MPTDTTKTDPVLRDELTDLKADLANIKDDIKSLADSAMGRARDEARLVRDRSKARVQSSIGSMEEYVEEQPLTSVLVAFGVGLLMGKLMSRG
jgi:ElaB/YqjD/DUF883 family membrane-anchored ribosome-binding protein